MLLKFLTEIKLMDILWINSYHLKKFLKIKHLQVCMSAAEVLNHL